MRVNVHVRFGGGPTEKARITETSPAAYPTQLDAVLPAPPLLAVARPGKEPVLRDFVRE
jgi:hypothetical protein